MNNIDVKIINKWILRKLKVSLVYRSYWTIHDYIDMLNKYNIYVVPFNRQTELSLDSVCIIYSVKLKKVMYGHNPFEVKGKATLFHPLIPKNSKWTYKGTKSGRLPLINNDIVNKKHVGYSGRITIVKSDTIELTYLMHYIITKQKQFTTSPTKLIQDLLSYNNIQNVRSTIRTYNLFDKLYFAHVVSLYYKDDFHDADCWLRITADTIVLKGVILTALDDNNYSYAYTTDFGLNTESTVLDDVLDKLQLNSCDNKTCDYTPRCLNDTLQCHKRFGYLDENSKSTSINLVVS